MHPKFLIIGNTAFSIENFRSQMLKDVAAKGFEVHCTVYADDPAELVAGFRARGWICHTLRMSRKGMNPFSDLRYAWDILKLLRSLKPDRVFCYTIKPVIYGGLAMLFAKVPRSCAMITGLGYAFMGQNKKQKFAEWVVKVLYRRAFPQYSLVVFQNPDDQSLFANQKLLTKATKTLLVAGSGVSLERFRYQPAKVHSPIKFLMVARILRAKGAIEYLEAAAAVHKFAPGAAKFSYLGAFDHGGDGIASEEFLEKCTKCGVDYLGETKDVIPFIEKADVFVLPSYREGLPRSTVEAMAIGRAVLTTDVPGCRETVVKGHNGLLVPVKDVGALAGAMLEMIGLQNKNANHLPELGANSRLLAEAKFDVTVVNRLIFRELL